MKRNRALPTDLTPASTLLGGRAAFAARVAAPQKVCEPVAMTTAVPQPLTTDVPAKHMSGRLNGPVRWPPLGSVSLRTGSDSPDIGDWSTCSRWAAISRRSAWITSPGRRITTSPGTRSSTGNSRSIAGESGEGRRRTVAVCVAKSRSARIALSDRDCCHQRTPADNATMAATVTHPRTSPITPSTTPRPPSSTRNGLPKAVRSRSPADGSRSAGRRFSPTVSKRCVASSSVKPRDELDSAVNTSNTDAPFLPLSETRNTGGVSVTTPFDCDESAGSALRYPSASTDAPIDDS